jgi:UDP-galactopyranose mutase
VVLIDSPYLEPLSRTIDRPLIYVAADAYRFYDWPQDQTQEYEQRIFERARASFAVSEPLVEDFRARGAKAVFQSPTAVGAEFAEAAQQNTPTPLDLAGIPHPRVGVVGKINSTYDWGLIETLAEARPDVSFVFIGPTRELDPREETRIVRAFARPNVFDLGAKPHSALPGYLNACDVLLNPLSVTDHNDRRFPLRLSEYLTTDRPVLTTSIHEARWFGSHVVSFADPTEALAALDAALRGEIAVDVEGRRRWLEQNTWEARASNVLAALESVGLAEAPSSNPC